MKKMILCLFFFSAMLSWAQEEKLPKYYSLDASYFYGSIMEHNPDIGHLITGHPTGVILSWNQKTYGLKEWERRYNYPDFGYSLSYQDMKNPYLGKAIGAYAHFNFYFFNRNLMFRIGQGLAYNTNPYDPDENFYNNAYGSDILSSTYLMGNFHKQDIIDGFGLQAGISIIHYSNADFRSPNNSTNTFTFNLGVNYLLNSEDHPDYIPRGEKVKYTEPVHYNFAIRSGVNSSGVVGSPQLPFLTIAAYADKVINVKSTLQGGAELILSRSLEEFIQYKAIAFPQQNNDPEADAKRVGAFVGHKLSFNKMALVTQLGYYIYYPYTSYVEQVYNRIGLERKITDDWWASATVRSHGANAEAVEFSIGYRL